MPNRLTRNSAFSLVEMLVVVTIVAVLVGLLFPLLTRVLASSEQAECTSNLRQCFTAISNYAADNDGYYPEPQRSTDGHDNWSLLIVPYYSNQPATYAGQGKAPPIQICPTNKKKIKSVTGKTFTSYYAENFALGPVSSQSTRPRRKMLYVPKPSTTILLTEAGYSSTTTTAVCDHYWLPLSATYNGKYEGGVHNGANNVLWCDGHVTAFRDVKKLIPPGPWFGGPDDQYFAPGFFSVNY